MTVSPLKKALMPALILTGTVFSSLTLPLAIFGTQPLVIQVQEEPIFVGKLKDVAAPYVGLATVLSLGAGVASLTLSGWQLSSRKAGKLEEQLTGLQQQLKEKELDLETLKLSEPRLQSAGLGDFLTEVAVESQPLTLQIEQDPAQAAIAQTIPTTEGQPLQVGVATTAQNPAQPAVEAQPTHSVMAANHLNYIQQMEEQLTALQKQIQEKEAQLSELQRVQFAKMPTAQLSVVEAYDATESLTPAAPVSAPMVEAKAGFASKAPLQTLAQVNELKHQLDHIMSQMGLLQEALQTEIYPATAYRAPWVDQSNIALHQLNQRIQKLESIWARQAIAS